MAGSKEEKRFLFFKYVPPKRGDKPLKDEEYSKKTGADAPQAEECCPPDHDHPKSPGYWDSPHEPECPEVPEYPDLPECPDIPEIPECPEFPELPDLPEFPELPECPELPEPPEIPEGPCPENAIMHIIQAGDTFWKLSKTYGTSVESIEAANPDVDPLNLQIGETLCIPIGIPGAKG